VTEQALPGGYVNVVTLVGGTVRRKVTPRAEFVHRVLAHLASHGWPGAPAYLGLDDQGRETLSYLPGHVAWQRDQPAGVRSEASLARTAQLVRELHDLTAGTELAGECEVVCHNDLSPRNTVYQDLGAGLRPVAFIDWDLAGPGRRIHDLGHVCWQYLNLGPDSWVGTDEAAAAECGRLIRVICDGYGLADRSELMDAILWWQQRCWRGIGAAADAGEPAMIRVRETGAVAAVQAAYQWTLGHRAIIDRALV
jgi:Phosphotransferase enzyme family